MRSRLLSFAGILAFAATGFAGPVNLGYISLDETVAPSGTTPGIDSISINNFTGDPLNGGFAIAPDFPSVTALTFSDVSVAVVENGVLNTYFIGNVAPGTVSPDILTFASTVEISSITLTGSFAPISLLLANGTNFLSTGTVTGAISNTTGAYLIPGVDNAVIEAASATVGTSPAAATPEPAATALVLAGLLAIGLRAKNPRR